MFAEPPLVRTARLAWPRFELHRRGDASRSIELPDAGDIVDEVLLSGGDQISFPGEGHVRRLLIDRSESDPLDLLLR